MFKSYLPTASSSRPPPCRSTHTAPQERRCGAGAGAGAGPLAYRHPGHAYVSGACIYVGMNIPGPRRKMAAQSCPPCPALPCPALPLLISRSTAGCLMMCSAVQCGPHGSGYLPCPPHVPPAPAHAEEMKRNSTVELCDRPIQKLRSRVGSHSYTRQLRHATPRRATPLGADKGHSVARSADIVQ